MKNKRSGGAGSKRGMGSAAGRTWQMYALFDDAGRLLDTGMGSKFTVRRIDLATALANRERAARQFSDEKRRRKRNGG
jgi:hypothetical protein